jgi:cutinase
VSTCNAGHILGLAVAMAWAPIAIFDTHHASARPCPDVEVVSARGTDEPPGPGSIGQTFIDSLRSKVPGRSVEVYGVNYPATDDFNRSESAGAGDGGAHVQSTVANCPDTKIVLDGYSQGAAVIDMITEELPPEVASHVTAVVVFGNPKVHSRESLGAASFLQSARSTAPRRLTCALPTTESALKARARPHIIYMIRTG